MEVGSLPERRGAAGLHPAGDGRVFLAELGSHPMRCSRWQRSRKVCGARGTGGTSSSAFLHAPRGSLSLEVENAGSCHGHNAYPKSQCPHSVIPCPSFPLHFLASGLLLSWCDTVCTWVLFVLLREKGKGRTARGCVSGRCSLAWIRCCLPTRYLSAPQPSGLEFWSVLLPANLTAQVAAPGRKSQALCLIQKSPKTPRCAGWHHGVVVIPS